MALSLCGCNGASNVDRTSDSISTSDSGATGSWNADAQALMKTYCGEVLPYFGDLTDKEIHFDEKLSTSGVKYLQIYFFSPSFVLEDYYEGLEANNWGVIEGYSTNVIREDDSGTKFCELTKIGSDGKTGYNLTYFFYPESEGEEGYNCVWCYNNATTTLTDDSSWSDHNSQLIEYVLMDSLPFIRIGSDYQVYQRSADQLSIYDYCAIDRREETAALLESNGFVADEEESEANDCEVLVKDIDAGTITAQLMYSSGNLFYFTFDAKKKTSKSWPSDFLAPIEQETGIKIPLFASKNYIYYEKHGVHYVYGYTDGDVSSIYQDALEDLGLIGDYLGNYTNWDETFALSCGSLVNSKYVVVGFEIIVGVTKPTSSFSASWPSEDIASFCKEVGIDVACPSPLASPNSARRIKYTSETDMEYWTEYWYHYIMENADWMGVDTTDKEAIRAMAEKTAKENIGLFMDIYDPDYSFSKAFEQQLYELAWHRESISQSLFGETDFYNMTFEDPTGTLSIVFWRTGLDVTRVTVMKGQGEANEPVFAFKETSVTLGLGDSAALEMNIDMLPYSVSYSCNDTSGKVHIDASTGVVSIDEDANVGDVVVVTATMNVPGEEDARTATVEIKVAERTPYTVDSAYDEVAARMNDFLKPASDERIRRNYYDEETEKIGYFEVNFGTRSVKKTKSVIETKMIPDSFVADGTWTKGRGLWGYTSEIIRYKCDGIVIEFQIYQSDDITGVIFLCYVEGTVIEESAH